MIFVLKSIELPRKNGLERKNNLEKNLGCVDKSHRINLTYSEIFANRENFEFHYGKKQTTNPKLRSLRYAWGLY
jgi:hypothetical protein